MPNWMPRNVRGTSRVPRTGVCQMCCSRTSPGRIHSTPQPVHVAAPDVVRREPGRVVALGVTVFCGAGAAAAVAGDGTSFCGAAGPRTGAGAARCGAGFAGAAAGAGATPFGAGGAGEIGALIHVGCEPDGRVAGGGAGLAGTGWGFGGTGCSFAAGGSAGFGAALGATAFGSWISA